MVVAIVVLVMAGLSIVFTWRRPLALVGVGLTASLFVRTLAHFTTSGIIGSLDDIFVVVVLVRAMLYRLTRGSGRPLKRSFPGIWFIVVFTALGLIGAAVHGGSMQSTLTGSYLALKGVAFGWAVAQFDWTASAIRSAWRWGSSVALIVAVSMAANMAVPSLWAATFSVSGGQIERYGFPSLFGPFVHPFDLAFACSMLAIAGAAFHRVFGKSRWATFVLTVGALGTVLSLRRKDLLGIGMGLFALVARLRRPGWLLAATLVLPIVLIWNWSFLSAQVHELVNAYASLTSREARTVLTLGGLHVASDYFPLGAGFGRYASRAAAVFYSPEYYRLGIDKTYGLGPGIGQGAFLTDTSWPAIIGETGFFGAAAYVLFLANFVRWFHKWISSSSGELRWVGFVGLGWLIVLLFESTGASVFASPPMFAFLPALVGAGVSLSESDALSTPDSKFDHRAGEPC